MKKITVTKKIKIVGIGALCIGLVCVTIMGIFAYTNIQNERTTEVTQSPTIDEQKTPLSVKAPIIATASFVDGDVVHKGSGTARIIDSSELGPLLEFNDFSTTIGPDLFVYLSPNKANEDLGEFVSLGKLKAQNGNQLYNLPANYKDYKTVVVWCRAFSVTFTTAEFSEIL